jgi:hypothetical protein
VSATSPPSRDLSRWAKRAVYDAARRFGGEPVGWEVFARLAAMPCATCGLDPAGGIDHVVPKAAGGRNIPENLQPMCPACNSGKAAKSAWRPGASPPPPIEEGPAEHVRRCSSFREHQSQHQLVWICTVCSPEAAP